MKKEIGKMKSVYNEINYRLAVVEYLREADVLESSIEAIKQALGLSRTTIVKVITNMHAAGEVEIIPSGTSKYCRLKQN